MSMLEPDLTGGASASMPTALPGTARPQVPTSGPIITRLPQTRRAFVNKYTALSPALPRIKAPVRNALIAFDLKRVERGQNPLSASETAAVVSTALTNRPATAPPKKNDWTPGSLLSAARRNVFQIGSSIPKLFIPNRGNPIYQEAVALKDLPDALRDAISQSDNPGEVIARVSEAPGVRFLPGSYVAGNIAEGDFAELARNPVMAALDVLPAANSAAKGTRVGGAAMRAAEGTGRAARPLRALATRTLDAEGALVPNRLGAAITRAAESTATGRKLSQTFGQDARATSRLWNRGNLQLADWLNPNGAPLESLPAEVREIAQVARDSITLQSTRARDLYGLDEARVADLTRMAQTADNATLSTLNDAELAFLDEARDLSSRYRRILVDSGDLIQVDDEVYDISTAGRMIQATDRAASAKARYSTDYRAKLEAMRGNDPRVSALIDDLDAEDYGAAYKRLTGLMRGKTRLGGTQRVGVAGERANASLASLKNLHNDLRDLLKKETKAASLDNRIAPSRFQSLIQSQADANYARTLAAQAADPTQAARILDLASQRVLPMADGWDVGTAAQFVEDATRTWRDLRDAGYDPMFVHRVEPTRAAMDLNFPRVHEKVPTPSQTKARGVLDLTAHVDDITVALSHQGLELLRQKGSAQFLDDMTSTFGVSEGELMQRYYDRAVIAAERNPSLDVMSHLRQLIEHDYSNVLSTDWGKTLTGDPSRAWVPKSVAKNLDLIHNGPKSSTLTAVLDPVMNVFRTSLLPLSPRWHAYNILGGGVMLGTRTAPSVLKHISEAREMIRAAKNGGESALPEELRLMVGQGNRPTLEFNYLGGRTLRRIWDQVQNAKVRAAGDSVAAAGSKVVQKSFDLNAFFDDTYRVMGYLYGKSKAERGGLAKEAAEREGIALARRVMQNWDELTPIERNVLRNLFPFYGFTQHIVRYVWNYPFDHPARAAILSSFARSELADLQGGLGELMLGAFQLGPMDDQGNVDTLNLAGWNPFADVSNLGTLEGFLGLANPVISTIAQQAGVDPITGGPDLYPDLEYDPTTGRLKADTGNFFLNLGQNILPQSRAVMAILGRNDQFKDLLRTNPEAASRALRSQLGLPSFTRTVNIPTEQFKAELARQEAQGTARANALKTGEFGGAMAWPGLRAEMTQIRQIQQQGQLGEFQPQVAIPRSQSALLEALRGTIPR